MKKKPKISYRELAAGSEEAKQKSPDSVPNAPTEARHDVKRPAKAPSSSKAQDAPELKTPRKKKKPGTSEIPASSAGTPTETPSPVQLAAALRNTPVEVLKAVAPPATPIASTAPIAAVVSPNVARVSPTPVPPSPARKEERVTEPSEPSLSQDIADYATTLMRRLAASAPSSNDEYGLVDRDTRSLRERVHGRVGVADLLMFRIGQELFATDLGAVEEAVELPEIHHLPEMPAAMLGAFNLRGRLTPIYSPAHVIGVPLRGAAAAALLVRANGRRMGLAVDDVEDVLQVDLAALREAPGIDDADGILLGVAHHGPDLVAVIDAEALVAACLSGQALETA
jgi:purine-binding chemotaxis protein CheW